MDTEITHLREENRRLTIELALHRAVESIIKPGYHEAVRALLRAELMVPDEVENVDAYVRAYAGTWATTDEAQPFLTTSERLPLT
jgi:hypothetical protein